MIIRRLENYHCNSKAAESNMFMQRCFSNLLLSVHKRKRMSIHGIQLVLVYASYPGLSLYCIVLKPNKCEKKNTFEFFWQCGYIQSKLTQTISILLYLSLFIEYKFNN